MNPLINSITLSALAFAASAHAETVDRSLEADARGAVEISNVAGTVNVTAWDKSEVHVKAELGENVERLEFERRGDVILVKVHNGRGHSGKSLLTLEIPRDSQLRVNGVSAALKIEGVRGAQRLNSVSGDIQTQLPGAELEARTVSGRIVAQGADKDAAHEANTQLATVSGSIRLLGASGAVEAESVSGDITVEGLNINRARFKTTSGDVEFKSSLAANARIEAETINGKLIVDLLGAPNAEFDIATFNGAIDNCFGPQPQSAAFGPGRNLRFNEGAGNARVRLRTLNGAVKLCRH